MLNTVLDQIPTEVAPGVPLPEALLEAASRRGGNHFVSQVPGVEGWRVSCYLPFATAFFKVDTSGRIYACGKQNPHPRQPYRAVLAGRVEDNQIQMENTPQ